MILRFCARRVLRRIGQLAQDLVQLNSVAHKWKNFANFSAILLLSLALTTATARAD